MNTPMYRPMNTAPQPFHAVVFDMDGTLLDTELVFKSVVFDVADELGYAMTEAVHLGMVGSSHEASNQMLVEAYGTSFPYALFDEKCRLVMQERMSETVPVKLGALDFLHALQDRGIPLAVATSSRLTHVVSHLGRAKLLDRFATIVTRDDVEHPKPHPEPYLTAARRLGIAPERCLALEDSHTGVRAAHAAGMQTIMVPDLVRPTDEIAALCLAVLPSLAEVHKFVLPPLAARA